MLLPMKKINLQIGSPTLFEEFWKDKTLNPVGISYNENTQYADSPSWISEEDLEAILRRIFEKKFPFLSAYKLIIGNGAGQLLQSYLFALSKEKTKIYIETPAWFDYFRMAEYAHMEIVSDPLLVDSELITLVNNPDNTLRKSKTSKSKGYDACYALQQYSYDETLLPHDGDAYFFSLSKLTGHASNRLGWAFVKDESLYSKISQSIDTLSTGVSRSSQIVGLQCLLAYEMYENEFVTFVQKALTERHQLLSDYFGELLLSKSGGMFAYIGISAHEFEQKYNILGVEGGNFCDTKTAVRINIACSHEIFNDVIQRIQKPL